MKKPDPLYTVAQAAEVLNVSPKTVRRHIRKRDLKAVRIGNRFRIDPVDLLDFIREHPE